MGLDIRVGNSFQDHHCSHNVREIAIAANIHSQLWRGENHPEIRRACHLVEPLNQAIAFIQSNRESLLSLNPVNGWGSVDSFLDFLVALRDDCQANRRRGFSVSR